MFASLFTLFITISKFLSLLASLREKHFTFFSDEAQNIISVEQIAVCATYEHNGVIAEHFAGIYPISKVVGTSLSSANKMKSLEEYFQNQSIDLTKAWFAWIDTTNVNSGEKGGFKWHLENALPYLIWVGCGNRNLAICFKHLLNPFSSTFEANVFLDLLWKFLKYRPLAKNLLEESTKMYDQNVVVPVTQWTAHERA